MRANMVGAYVIDCVANVTTADAGEGRTQIAFMRYGGGPPPEIEVPLEARIVADGKDWGVRRICCTGRDPRPGGFVSIKVDAE